MSRTYVAKCVDEAAFGMLIVPGAYERAIILRERGTNDMLCVVLTKKVLELTAKELGKEVTNTYYEVPEGEGEAVLAKYGVPPDMIEVCKA